MQRRRPRSLGAVGGTGWGSAPRQPLASDSEDEEPPRRCPNTADTASPHVVLESDLEESDVSPNVPVLRKRLPPPSTLGCADLDVGGPKKRRLEPKMPPNPGVEPQNQCVSPEEVVSTDVERWRGSDPTLGIESDTDDEEHPKSAVLHPNRHQSALKRSADPGVAQRTPNLDMGGTRNGRWVLTLDSDTDKEEAELLPPIRRPKMPRKTPNVPQSAATVGMKSPQSDPRGPNNGFQVTVVGSDTDVEVGSSDLGVGSSQSGRWALTVDSDTDVEESGADPDVEQPPNHQMNPNVPKVGLETSALPPEGPREDRLVLMVDSDTDVEDRIRVDPDVLCSTTHRVTQNESTPPGTEADGPQKGQRAPEVSSDPDVGGPPPGDPHPEVGGPEIQQQLPMVDSDTDVEEDIAYARVPVGAPKPLIGAGVVVETPNPHLKGPESRCHNLEVDSDTDLEGEELNPDVPHPEKHRKNHRAAQISSQDPAVVMETPNPNLKGSQRGGENWEVDSDTDVEEELHPDVPDLKNHEMRRIAPKDPAVVMETPNPGLKGSQVGGRSLEVDSDTDVEDELNPDVSHSEKPQMPQIAPQDPAVVMETPNPGLKGSQVGGQSVQMDSDTDVEAAELNPDVPHPENPQTPQRAPKDPAVVTETPNPDAVALNGDSDTDVEDLGGIEAPQTHKATQRFIDSDAVAASAPDVAPAVAMTAPNPAVSPPTSPGGGSDTDGEEVAPTPHIRSRIRPQNPNVGSAAMSGSADVGQTNPKCGKSAPKRQSLPPEPCGDGAVGGTAPKRHNSAPDADTESPKATDGTQRHSGEASKMGSDAAAAPAPKSPDPAPNLGLTADGQHRPNGDTDVTESDIEAEDDPDLLLASTQNFLPPTQNFLPPTQNFLPPTQNFLPPTQNFLQPPTQGGCPPDPTPAWDPEEPTQCFYHPKEEEEEEEPPQSHVATRVPTVMPAQDDLGTLGAPSKDVGEGPRRSQRQTRSRGGGASREGGGAKASGGGARADPAPLRRSPRLLARPLPAEPKMGRGQDEPRPAPAPRPRRGGHAPSQKKAREEEPADVTRPQLRPRGSSASSRPKVLFTGVVASPEMEAALEGLGGSMAASIFDCTHLVTDRVRRTVKFLCAVARGIAIVTPAWLHQSARSGRVLPPGPFLVRDKQQEQHFGFSLSQALSCARRRPLLQGYEVHVTPSVRPEPEQMKDIITCSGGTFLPAMPCTYGPRRLVISCPEDAGRWGPALGAHLPLLSAELLLTGLLRQQLQLQPFLLTPPEPPQDPPVSPRRLRDRTHRDPPGTQRRGRLGVK